MYLKNKEKLWNWVFSSAYPKHSNHGKYEYMVTYNL